MMDVRYVGQEVICDLGLASLGQFLKDPIQFSSRQLFLEQVLEPLPLQEVSRVVLYQGKPWSLQGKHDPLSLLRDRDTVAHYLDLLLEPFAKTIPFALDIEVTGRVFQALYLQPDLFERFEKIWHEDSQGNQALLLPSHTPRTPEILEQYMSYETVGRLIQESDLIYAWQGLDRLFVSQEMVSEEGRRMVAGFVAAGGDLVWF